MRSAGFGDGRQTPAKRRVTWNKAATALEHTPHVSNLGKQRVALFELRGLPWLKCPVYIPVRLEQSFHECPCIGGCLRPTRAGVRAARDVLPAGVDRLGRDVL